jgi:hypothetical protein
VGKVGPTALGPSDLEKTASEGNLLSNKENPRKNQGQGSRK